jgi:hypothetical protein
MVLAVQIWFGTYSVLDVDKPGVPKLTSIQLRWLGLIRKAPGYQKRWPYLRFTLQPAHLHLKGATPLVVFDADDWNPKHAGFGLFHVIGEPCNAAWSPDRHSYVGPSEASCLGPPHYAPVPGQQTLHD